MGLEIKGLDEIIDTFGGIDGSLDTVMDEMLSAKGDVVVEAQKKTAGTMLQGPYNKRAVMGAVTKGKARKIKGGRALDITFEGEQHGNRLAEIAYVNEFGKTNQPARPFIQTANEQSADAATEAAADVLDRHLKNKGL